MKKNPKLDISIRGRNGGHDVWCHSGWPCGCPARRRHRTSQRSGVYVSNTTPCLVHHESPRCPGRAEQPAGEPPPPPLLPLHLWGWHLLTGANCHHPYHPCGASQVLTVRAGSPGAAEGFLCILIAFHAQCLLPGGAPMRRQGRAPGCINPPPPPPAPASSRPYGAWGGLGGSTATP